MSNIGEIVDKYAEWDKLVDDGKKEINKYKADIQKEAVSKLENSKTKQVKFWGNDSNCAIATSTESVKLISIQYLKQMVPENVLADFIKEEKDYKMTDAFKKMLAPICLGDYVEQKVADVIDQIPTSDDNKKLARKKLKGVWEKDKAFLISIGLKSEDAEHWAYFISEANAWEKVSHFLKVSGYQEGTEEFMEALDNLKKAVIVDEGIKIGIEYKVDDENE